MSEQAMMGKKDVELGSEKGELLGPMRKLN